MIFYSRVVRDLCLIAAGTLAYIDTPPSVQDAGIYGPLSKVWACMIGLGAMLSLFGVLRGRRSCEIIGCSFVGGGFLVWAFAIFTVPHLNLTAITIALVFLALTAGQFYRVAVLGRPRRSMP